MVMAEWQMESGAEEVVFLEHYITIQKIRFGDKLQTHIDISRAAQHALVPSLFLRLSNRLEVRVLDDGVGLPSGWSLEDHDGLV